MEITTYSSFRQKLSSFMDLVTKSQSPLFVTRQGKEDLVLLSKSDYEGIMETFHLMSSPKNAERINASIKEYESGGGIHKALIED
ncbi:MAG: type II toxin-antitoxin system prevent-host-death family antitoxin [Reichenbachiella sp.]